MPTYEYLCSACQHNFEQVQKISEDSLTECPACGKNELKRIINATAFHLKGSGWYKTDYASNNSSSAPSPSTTSNGTSNVVEKKEDNKVVTPPATESPSTKASTSSTTDTNTKN